MKKLSAFFAVVTLLTASFVGCGDTLANNGRNDRVEGTSISVCLASEPDSIDPALNSTADGATMIVHAFSGLARWQKDEDGVLSLVADCAKSLPEGKVGEDGKVTYVFELKEGLKWSDGSELTAQDFAYSWNRAVDPATASDYSYMFDIIDRETLYEANVNGTGLYDLDENGEYAEVEDTEAPDGAYDKKIRLNVTASEDGKKLTVVLRNSCTYFYELLAFPTYMPVKRDTIEDSPDTWATEPSSYIGNGPYTMTEWQHNSKIVYRKNDSYHDADSITVDEITFYLSDDENAMLANYMSGAWQFIDDVPNAEIESLRESKPDEFFVEGQLGTYYVIFNVNKAILPVSSVLRGEERELAQAEIRRALGLLLDRNYICEEIGQAGQIPAASFVAMGLTDADGKTEFAENSGSSEEYNGYYDVSEDSYESNSAEAVEILKKYYTFDESTSMFTDVPTLEYIYNTDDSHKAIAEYIQGALGAYGITVTITNQEWNTFLNTRKNGDYNIARNGWLADYNDPMSFLDMWMTDSGSNDAQFGRGEHASAGIYSLDLTEFGMDYKVENATWAQTYDRLCDIIKNTADTEIRYALMHKLEDILMRTGAICPIYYNTDLYMCSSSLEGVYTSPLGYKYFMYATTVD